LAVALAGWRENVHGGACDDDANDLLGSESSQVGSVVEIDDGLASAALLLTADFAATCLRQPQNNSAALFFDVDVVVKFRGESPLT